MRRTLRLAPLGLLLALAGAALSPVRAGDAPLTRDDIAWLRRASFGIDSATLQRYRELGRTGWLDAALADRDDHLPPAIQQQIDGYEAIATPPAELVRSFRESLRQVKAMPEGDARVAAKKAALKHGRELLREAQQAELLHAIYGSNPLKEQMVWFWLNHFSVYGNKGPVKLLAADYEEHVIRPHAMGKFRDLVMATLKSPAMLVYLDNAQNAKGKINENYARELMELHTLGVHAGYTQQDVQQLAAILTGVGILPPRQLMRGTRANRPGRFGRFGGEGSGVVRQGLFEFIPARHDDGDKVFLGQRIEGGGFDEVEHAVDLIVRQPACAQFISRQLAEYFVSDHPPQALVDAMADTFQRTDGDIAAVLRTLFTSKEITATAGAKFKDPMQFLVSAMRFSLDGRPISNVRPLVGALYQMGEPIYGRITPDGWPLDNASWSGSGQMAKRFDIAGMIGSGRAPLFAPDGTPPRRQPGERPDPPALNGPLFAQAMAPWLSPHTRDALAQARTPVEWNTFLLSSPDFNTR
ncbi:MAG: DUF1800 family protein [Xanthomonadaceae bacterium]|nr:DUF1800 family protein [Xanthomonadaceae bacterium]MDE1963750.1 DUF1800 domain-containing protein [Xanthomonadaceae bacterium]